METETKKPLFFITLRARLFIGFMTLSLPLVVLIMLLLPKINTIVRLSETIHHINLSSILDTQIYQARDIVSHWMLTGDPRDMVRFSRVWEEIEDSRERWEAALLKLNDPELLQRWDKLKVMYEPYHDAQVKLLHSSRGSHTAIELNKIQEEIRPLSNAMLDIINGPYSDITGEREGGLYSLIMLQITKNTHRINNSLFSLKRSAFGLLVLSILLTIIVPLVTLRAIRKPVDYAINIAERIASGERDVEISIYAQDKLGKLLSSLKAMQEAIKVNEEKLRNQEEGARQLFENLVTSSKRYSQYSCKVAAGDLRDRLEIDKEDILYDLGKDLNLMTDSLASSAKKIADVSNNIVIMVDKVLTSANEQTEGINSQASAINEISASLEEIDKSSKQTMNKAQALREVAKNTYEQGKLGSESVAQSISGIKASEEQMKLIAQTILDLSNHTQQIGEITAVVNTLAQQSKMLALNAAIEASKAGDAGKGFAAVATEVKNLAEQSEQSTVQVQKILEDIRRTTEKAVTVTDEGAKTLDSGSKLIEKAGEVIHALSKMINEASISSQHIEVAIRQETVGIEQIVESMNEINRTTSTFSGGIKEMMAFINQLDEIAKHLKDDVSIYKM